MLIDSCSNPVGVPFKINELCDFKKKPARDAGQVTGQVSITAFRS